jgi:nucleotide-binding universal stress UspA family protein
MFGRILLAVDGSEQAKEAVRVAVDLARKSSGEIFICHVHEKGLVSRETVDLESRDEARELTDAVLDVVRKAGVPARSELRVSGTAGVAKEILEAAREFDVDTIVLGSRGLGDLAGLLLGSVAHKVIQLADCPVVVVRQVKAAAKADDRVEPQARAA